MRVSSYLFLAAGIVLAALTAVLASDVTAFLAVQPSNVRLLLIGTACAFALVWLQILRLSVLVDRQHVAARVGDQEGREAGARLRQKSVDLEDRQDALEEYISVADARRALRDWIAMEVTLPYVALLCVLAFVLFLALKSIGGIP